MKKKSFSIHGNLRYVGEFRPIFFFLGDTLIIKIKLKLKFFVTGENEFFDVNHILFLVNQMI